MRRDIGTTTSHKEIPTVGKIKQTGLNNHKSFYFLTPIPTNS